jgi:hypothetical protein
MRGFNPTKKQGNQKSNLQINEFNILYLHTDLPEYLFHYLTLLCIQTLNYVHWAICIQLNQNYLTDQHIV